MRLVKDIGQTMRKEKRMSNNLETIVLTDDQKKYLDSLCEDYNIASEEFTSYDNKKKALNSLIKQTFVDFGIDKYQDSCGRSFSTSSRPNVSWDEEALLCFCKNLNYKDLVKTKEFVDFDVLESLIYHEVITPEQLKPFQTKKPDIVTLRVSQKKMLKE